jgi:single-stranded DNA-binding protein
MNYKEMKTNIENMAQENYEDFIKALISFEKGLDDSKALDAVYQSYMDNDTQGLLNDEFDNAIEDLKEQGLIKDRVGVQEERDDLINIVGNLAGDVEVLDLKNHRGQPFQVVNFSVVSNDEEGNKSYHNCSAYGEKGKIPATFQKGDFVKLFGQVRKSMDEHGKEHTNVRILDSKLLKARDRTRDQAEQKQSILGQIKGYKEAEKVHDIKKEIGKNKENER